MLPPKFVSREDAIALGLKRYFQGVPCKHGHMAQRTTLDGRCTECHRLRMARWTEENGGYQKEYRQANAEHIRELVSEWNKNNVEIKREYTRRRRVKLRASDIGVSRGIVEKLLRMQRGMCACCKAKLKKTGIHLDHVLPVSRGGEHVDSNVQLLCPPCNRSKSAKHPVDFMRSRGYLL